MNYRQIMIADGAPKGLFLTAAQRAKAWAGRPLTTESQSRSGVSLFQSTPKSETAETAAFRAQVEEERRLKSLAGIQRMKNRFAAKAVDYSKMRWDARRAKFVPIDVPVLRPTAPRNLVVLQEIINRQHDSLQRVDYANARRLAEINGVWDDKYTKLSGGLLVMTITNRLKGLVKKGGMMRWA